ncbi:MAG: LPP20 family lipoprotein [Candidatus Cloacimonetes bacterium]|nr:LPP20 family lipoprotein [Candidatus Cloacimonadota bacterium]
MRKALLLLLVILTVSCAVHARRGNDSRPGWLNDPKSLYPDNIYLSAIGEGDTRRQAEADAAASLARIFETRVETQSTFEEHYYELVVGDQADAVTTTNQQQDITLSSQQTLLNVQYGESHTDNLGRTHIIGYIDRMRTGQVYEEKIDRGAGKVRNFLRKGRQSEDLLAAYAYISAALVISDHNETLMEQLAIISPTMHEFIELGYRHEEILAERRETGQQIGIDVRVTGDSEGKVEAVLRELLSQRGFALRQNGLLRVNAEVRFEDVDLNQPDKAFVRWHLTVNVERAAGESLVSYYEKQREGSINRSQAVAFSYREMEKKLRNNFMKQFMGYLAGLAE